MILKGRRHVEHSGKEGIDLEMENTRGKKKRIRRPPHRRTPSVGSG